MAYQNYQPYYQNYPNYPNPNYQQSSADIVWVQGEAGAKAYPVQSGRSVLLMDSENSVFYIKSTDTSGMPQPLRIFSYEELQEGVRNEPSIDTSKFITRDEFEKAIADLSKKQNQNTYQRKEKNNVKPII